MRRLLGTCLTAIMPNGSNDVGIIVDYDEDNFMVEFLNREDCQIGVLRRSDFNPSEERSLVTALKNDVVSITEFY